MDSVCYTLGGFGLLNSKWIQPAILSVATLLMVSGCCTLPLIRWRAGQYPDVARGGKVEKHDLLWLDLTNEGPLRRAICFGWTSRMRGHCDAQYRGQCSLSSFSMG